MIRLAIFDMDGTIFESYLDWNKIKEDLGITGNILKELYKGNTVDSERLNRLEKYEEENTFKIKPIKGVIQYQQYLNSFGIKCVLATNNNKKNTDFLLKKYNISFETVITREMKLWKPEPAPLLYLMNMHNCEPDEVISIGDSHYDVKASRAAGIENIFIIKREGTIPPGIEVNGSSYERQIVYFNDFIDLKKISERDDSELFLKN